MSYWKAHPCYAELRIDAPDDTVFAYEDDLDQARLGYDFAEALARVFNIK